MSHPNNRPKITGQFFTGQFLTGRLVSPVLVGSEGRRLCANNRMTLKMNGHLLRSRFVLGQCRWFL